MDNNTNTAAARIVAAADAAVAAERTGDSGSLIKAANAAGRAARAAGWSTDDVATICPQLVAAGMGDAWAHLVDSWHGR